MLFFVLSVQAPPCGHTPCSTGLGDVLIAAKRPQSSFSTSSSGLAFPVGSSFRNMACISARNLSLRLSKRDCRYLMFFFGLLVRMPSFVALIFRDTLRYRCNRNLDFSMFDSAISVKGFETVKAEQGYPSLPGWTGASSGEIAPSSVVVAFRNSYSFALLQARGQYTLLRARVGIAGTFRLHDG